MMTTSHRPVERGALLSTSKHQLTTLYPSFPLQVPTIHRNNIKICSENTVSSLHRLFFVFKTKPALLFLGTCSWDKSLDFTSLCSRAGVCPKERDTPTLKTVLLLTSELSSFFSPFSKFFPNPPLLLSIFSYLLASFLNTTVFFASILSASLFIFSSMCLSPHILFQNFSAAHYQASLPLTPCSWPLPRLSCLLLFPSSLSFSARSLLALVSPWLPRSPPLPKPGHPAGLVPPSPSPRFLPRSKKIEQQRGHLHVYQKLDAHK